MDICYTHSMSGKENYTGGENKNEDAPTGWEDVAKMAGKMNAKPVSEMDANAFDQEGVWTLSGEGPDNGESQDSGDSSDDNEGSTADIDMPPAPADIDVGGYDEEAVSGTGGGVELSGSELVKAFADSRKNFESYAEETSGKTIEEIAPTFIEDEAFFNQAMRDLMGEGDSARSADDISEQDLINYYNARRQESIKAHNDLNVEISNKEKSLGFFGRRFGKGARELKALKAKQTELWGESRKMEQRLGRLYDMLEKDDKE